MDLLIGVIEVTQNIIHLYLSFDKNNKISTIGDVTSQVHLFVNKQYFVSQQQLIDEIMLVLKIKCKSQLFINNQLVL